ncbi:50S ribosomal protein L4 [Candidatus Burarchaeum australiense]|nr:50S ribosomal protein L4 [Candidatus Burarchaeum australiense]
MIMKANVYTLAGDERGSVELPQLFSEPIRHDLIARAVLAEESRTRQPKGAYKWAGLQTSAEYRGRKEEYGSIKNKGISRLPREKLPKGRFGKVRRVPFSVKGRRAFPPNVNEILVEKINERERQKAMRSALAATVSKSLVKERGHLVDALKSYPVVIENAFEALSKTKDVVTVLGKLGYSSDMARARRNSKPRSGVMGGRRGGTKRPKSLLIIVAEDKGIGKGARNISGVDVALTDKLSARLLAPGTHPGRLAIFSEAAIEKLRKW